MAALLPVNANETDLAAQCIAARAQAEDVMRLIREHAGDIALTIRLNAQYASMVRTALSVEARLMRVQAVRRKREAIEGAADQDTRRRQVVERCMLMVADPDIERPAAAAPVASREALGEAPEAKPAEAPVAAPTPPRNQGAEKNVSENKTNSHHVAFETWMSEQPWNQGAR